MIKIIKEILTNWSVNGRKLNPPLTMVRRVTTIPFIWLFAFITSVFIAIGFGLESGIDHFKEIL